MQFFNSLSGHLPLPSVSDLEASHFELQYGPYPEFSNATEEKQASQQLPTQRSSSQSWIARFMARSPQHIIEKRAALLRSSSNRSSFEQRRSADLESQASTDVSTLLDQEPVKEKSKIGARVISDAIIGLSDGLTVPFALAAGLATLGNTRVVIFAGLAELTAGAISMGLGGYLGAKSEEESYTATLNTTRETVTTSPIIAASSITSILQPYDIPETLISDLQFHLTKSPHLTDFLMHFEHNVPEPEPSRAITCALTIATGYFLGGFIPLLPYLCVPRGEVMLALWCSLGVMAVSLFVFGYGKTCFVSGWRGCENIWSGTKGGLQMMVVGGLAAGSAMGLVRLFDGFAQAGS